MSLQIQVTADVASAGKQIEDFSKRSRTALNSLSLVAQDLPFGFIGIQNNLPGVISSFGELTREAGGLKGALKQIGTALVGPAGLFLAFSTATAAVTFAIQKYGSFGAAIDALFGKINPLAKVIKDASKSQEDFNEAYKTTGQILASATGSVESQILKVQLLSDTVTNLSNSEELRKNALSQLQKIDKAYFSQITTGASDVSKLEEATRKYTDALLANAIAKGFEEKVTQASINLEEQRNLLAEISKGYDDIAKKRQGKQKEFVLFTGGKPIKETVLEVAKLNETFNKQKLVVDEAVKSVDKLKESFKNATLDGLAFVEPLEQGSIAVKDYKYQIDELIGALSFKTQIEDVKELADVILDVNKKYTSRATALKELQQLGDGVFNGLTLEKKGYDNLKDAIDTYILKLQTLDLEIKGRINAGKLQEQADKNRLNYLQEQLKLEQKISKETFAQADKQMNADSKAFTKISFDNIGKLLNPMLEEMKNLAIGAKNVAILMEETFFNPLNEMFTTLFTKFTFSIKSFTNAILQSIAQIAAKLATTLVIQGLVSLFSAPLALGGALSPDGALGFIGKALGGMKSGKSADFSGVQGANMVGMSGSVNLVLRGTDLVGSINRTNSQISRVG
jgi:hypothetical protein